MPVTPEQRHVVYGYLINRCLESYYPTRHELVRLKSRLPVKVAYGINGIVPGLIGKAFVDAEMRRVATLDGIPGFYFYGGVWRLNWPERGLLVPYENHTGKIQGLRIYCRIGDERYSLLTSRNLPRGTKAVPCRETIAYV